MLFCGISLARQIGDLILTTKAAFFKQSDLTFSIRTQRILTMPKLSQAFKTLLGAFVCLGMINPVLAEEPGVDKLLLTPQQREEIDQQRLQYLQSLQVGEVEQEIIPPEVKPVKKAGPYSPPKPRNLMSKKIAVSAVIEEPNGQRTVRINNKYQTQPTPKVPLELNQTTFKGVALKNGDKTVVVPVGTTYFSRKDKVVESYKLQQSKAKSQPERAILNADNRAVKQTLKDVKTVNTPQP